MKKYAMFWKLVTVVFFLFIISVGCSQETKSSGQRKVNFSLKLSGGGSAESNGKLISEEEWIKLVKDFKKNNSSPKNLTDTEYVFEIEEKFDSNEIYNYMIKISECGLFSWNIRLEDKVCRLSAVTDSVFESISLLSENDYKSINKARYGTKLFRNSCGTVYVGKVITKESYELGEPDESEQLAQMHEAEIIFIFMNPKSPAKLFINLALEVFEMTGKPPIVVIIGREHAAGF